MYKRKKSYPTIKAINTYYKKHSYINDKTLIASRTNEITIFLNYTL